jgi:hypothetical protein
MSEDLGSARDEIKNNVKKLNWAWWILSKRHWL